MATFFSPPLVVDKPPSKESSDKNKMEEKPSRKKSSKDKPKPMYPDITQNKSSPRRNRSRSPNRRRGRNSKKKTVKKEYFSDSSDLSDNENTKGDGDFYSDNSDIYEQGVGAEGEESMDEGDGYNSTLEEPTGAEPDEDMMGEGDGNDSDGWIGKNTEESTGVGPDMPSAPSAPVHRGFQDPSEYSTKVITVQMNISAKEFLEKGCCYHTVDAFGPIREKFAREELKRARAIENQARKQAGKKPKTKPFKDKEIKQCMSKIQCVVKTAKVLNTWNTSPFNILVNSKILVGDTAVIDNKSCAIGIRRNHTNDQYDDFLLHTPYDGDHTGHEALIDTLKDITPEKLKKAHRKTSSGFFNLNKQSPMYKAISSLRQAFDVDDMKELESQESEECPIEPNTFFKFAKTLICARARHFAFADNGALTFTFTRSTQNGPEELKKTHHFMDKGVLNSQEVEEFKHTYIECGFKLKVDIKFMM